MVNLSDASPLQNVIDKFGDGGVNYRIFVDNGHIGVFSVGPDTVKTADGIVQSGEWTHIAASFDGTNVTFYANGERVGDPQAFSTNGANSGDLRIGRDDLGRYVDGMIDDVRIWNDARTADEIRDNYDHLVLTDDDGLVGNWTFDTTDGTTVADRSDNNLHGTLTNGADVSNQPHNAMRFDGGDLVVVPDDASLDGMSALTVETWVKFDDVSGGEIQTLVAKMGGTDEADRQYHFYETDNGALGVYIDNDGDATGGEHRSLETAEGAVTSDKWHHVAFVYDGGVLKILVDGVVAAIDTNADIGTINAGGGTLGIGGRTNTGVSHPSENPSQLLSGELADVRIWNTARTDAQISDNADKTIVGNEGGALVAHYEFNELSGQTVTDSAGNNDGTLGAADTAGTDDPTRVDTTPEILSLDVAIQENQTGCGTMTANDVVPGSAVFGISTSTAHDGTTSLTLSDNKGTVNIDSATGAWTFTPAENFNGQAQFYVTASGGGVEDAERITVDVQALSLIHI